MKEKEKKICIVCWNEFIPYRNVDKVCQNMSCKQWYYYKRQKDNRERLDYINKKKKEYYYRDKALLLWIDPEDLKLLGRKKRAELYLKLKKS